MGTLKLNTTQQFRRDAAAEWTEKNPVLLEGEPGLELDTGKMKMGDGVSDWNALPYFMSDKANADLSNVNDDVFLAKANQSGIGVATSNKVGLVKPDGTTITVATDGKIAAKQAEIATTTKAGIIKPDGITLSIDANGQLKVVCDIGLFVEKNAGAHNSIYRGKYLGTTVTSAQYASISAGTFDDLFIGDYWTISGVNYRIAAFDYYWHKGNTDCTTHHVVIVPDTNLYTHKMNDTNVTTGGYYGSKMYTQGLTQAKTIINDAFGSAHILSHRISLSNKVTDDYETGRAWYDSTVELMTEISVYGCRIYDNINNGTVKPTIWTVNNSQFPLFALAPEFICNRAGYWLQDVVTSAYFALVYKYGNASTSDASDVYGVRPSFCIY